MAASRTRYTTVAIVIHWLIAAALIFQIILGWRMGDGPKGPTTYALFQLHKSIGITILLLSLARLAWRLFNTPPAPPEGQPKWEQVASKLVHIGFYVIMIGLPLTGWILVSASRVLIPTLLFGTMPWPHIPGLPELAAGPKHLWYEIGELGPGMPVAAPDPQQGHQGDEGAEQHQLQHGCQIVECLLGHQCSLPDSYNCRWFRPAARNSPRPASGPGWPVRAGGVSQRKVACTHHGVGPTGCVLGATPPRPHLLGRRWWQPGHGKAAPSTARRHQKTARCLMCRNFTGLHWCLVWAWTICPHRRPRKGTPRRGPAHAPWPQRPMPWRCGGGSCDRLSKRG